MKKILWGSFVFLVFLNNIGFTIEISELQKKMIEASHSIRTLQTQFTQEWHAPNSLESYHSSGILSFKKPHFIRIERELGNELILTSGNEVQLYSPKLNQLILQSWRKWKNENIWIVGLTESAPLIQKLTKRFEWKLVREENLDGEVTQRVLLKNLSSKNHETFTLWIRTEDFLVKKIEYDSDSLIWTAAIQNSHINGDLDSSLFQFHIPPNTRVLHL